MKGKETYALVTAAIMFMFGTFYLMNSNEYWPIYILFCGQFYTMGLLFMLIHDMIILKEK